jgi:hypothetical protein
MADAVFRPLQPDRFDLAHGILVSAADWLSSKGIRQWTTAYPKELYRAHQAKGWNYGLFIDEHLAVIVTLGVLVSFYERAGFSLIDRRPLQFATGEFDMVLMSATI